MSASITNTKEQNGLEIMFFSHIKNTTMGGGINPLLLQTFAVFLFSLSFIFLLLISKVAAKSFWEPLFKQVSRKTLRHLKEELKRMFWSVRRTSISAGDNLHQD